MSLPRIAILGLISSLTLGLAACGNDRSTPTSPTPAPPPQSGPDLVVSALSRLGNGVRGEQFTLFATVRNIGDGAAASTTLRYYQSTDTTITTADTVVGTNAVAALTASGSSNESVRLTFPLTAGTYHYTACVDAVADELDTTNNCSPTLAFTTTVAVSPNLVVSAFSVSDSNPVAYEPITLSATVRNVGDEPRAATTLSFYLDAPLLPRIQGLDYYPVPRNALPVPGLGPLESFDVSVVVRAPSSGTYSYAACVDQPEDISSFHCADIHAVTVEEPPTTTPPDDPSTVDPRFDDLFWQDFVFAHMSIFQNPVQFSPVLNTTSPNVYIRTGDSTGQQVVPDQWRDAIRDAVPSLAWQLTGQRYSGRIESGIGDREQPGWITVRFVAEEDGDFNCVNHVDGRARLGADPGAIWISIYCYPEDKPGDFVDDPSLINATFAHEFGHAMGFSHVTDASAVMNGFGGEANNRAMFSTRESYHAQLAYKVGRGAEYCGWPFSAACTRSPAGFRFRGAPVVVD